MTLKKIRSFFKGSSGDSFSLMLVRIVTILAGMLMTRILSEYFSVEDYGTYSQVMLLVSTIVSVTILGMMDGTNYFYYNNRGPQERQQYISTILTIQCMLGILVAGILFLLRKPICTYFSNASLEWLLLFAAVLSLTQNIVSILQVLFMAIGKARLIAARNLVLAVAKLVLFTAACRILHSVAAILMVSVVLNLIQIFYFQYVLRKNQCVIPLRSTNFHLTGRIFSYCIPMAAFVMLSALARDCDRYIISAFTDTDTLAVYTNASKMLPFDLITVSFCTVLVPYLTRYISEENFEKALSLYRLFLELCMATTLILAVSALVGAPMLMELLYSSKYICGLPVFTVYILVDIFRTLNITLIMSAAGKGRSLLVISVVSLLANIALNIVLFRLLGMIGPALSTLLITGANGLVIQRGCAKILKTNLKGLFDWKYLGILLSELGFFFLVFSGISRLLMAEAVAYILRLLIVSGGFFGTMSLLNFKRILNCIAKIGSYR